MSDTREWCFPFLHDWPKWSEVRTGKRTNVYYPHIESLRREEVLTWNYQVRECKRCNQRQTRDV